MNVLAFAENDVVNTILIAAGIVLAAGVLVVVIFKIVRSHRARKRVTEQQEREQAIEQGVQEKLMEIRDGYLVMSRNVTYSVGSNGEIAIGKYRVKSSVSTDDEFNLRLNGLVETYHDGDIITLGADDTICAVSNTVLLETYVDPALKK